MVGAGSGQRDAPFELVEGFNVDGHDASDLSDVIWCAGRTRTDTPVKASGPKPGASTNFATARGTTASWLTARGPELGNAAFAGPRRQPPASPPARPRPRESPRERRSLRELPGGLLAVPAAASPADRRDLSLRPHRRRHRRRRRRDARANDSQTSPPFAPISWRSRRLGRRRRAGPRCSGRWPARYAHRLPVPLLADLLDAFAQDARRPALRRSRELLDYCRRSANPIGRLLLHLYGIDDARRAGASGRDLQRAAARQLLAGPGRRLPRGPSLRAARRCARHGVATRELLARRDSDRVHALVADSSPGRAS